MSGDIEETYFYIGLGEIRSEGRIATQRPCRDVSSDCWMINGFGDGPAAAQRETGSGSEWPTACTVRSLRYGSF
jgi:hypothetical protein